MRAADGVSISTSPGAHTGRACWLTSSTSVDQYIARAYSGTSATVEGQPVNEPRHGYVQRFALRKSAPPRRLLRAVGHRPDGARLPATHTLTCTNAGESARC